jgi:hypothetical protein
VALSGLARSSSQRRRPTLRNAAFLFCFKVVRTKLVPHHVLRDHTLA